MPARDDNDYFKLKCFAAFTGAAGFVAVLAVATASPALFVAATYAIAFGLVAMLLSCCGAGARYHSRPTLWVPRSTVYVDPGQSVFGQPVYGRYPTAPQVVVQSSLNGSSFFGTWGHPQASQHPGPQQPYGSNQYTAAPPQGTTVYGHGHK